MNEKYIRASKHEIFSQGFKTIKKAYIQAEHLILATTKGRRHDYFL